MFEIGRDCCSLVSVRHFQIPTCSPEASSRSPTQRAPPAPPVVGLHGRAFTSPSICEPCTDDRERCLIRCCSRTRCGFTCVSHACSRFHKQLQGHGQHGHHTTIFQSTGRAIRVLGPRRADERKLTNLICVGCNSPCPEVRSFIPLLMQHVEHFPGWTASLFTLGFAGFSPAIHHLP
jgi:hypothetical protein